MVRDISLQLRLHADYTFLSQSFNRTNLFYRILPKRKKAVEELRSYISQHYPDACGIVYCFSRESSEKVAEALRACYIKALHFHAGLDADEKKRVMDEWQAERCNVIVATVRIMGRLCEAEHAVRLHLEWVLIKQMVSRASCFSFLTFAVRFIIHYDMPKSLEGYFIGHFEMIMFYLCI